MKFLFDIGHPAHVHLFRHLINHLERNGHTIFAATRQKDVTVSLCEAYHIHQQVISKAYKGSFHQGFEEFVQRTLVLLRIARCFKPDALLGTSLSIGIVGRLIRKPSFVLNEDDASVVPLFAKIAYPPANYIVTPECLKYENYGNKHIVYPGYHELGYLHPNVFKPNPELLETFGINSKKIFFIVRLVALKAYHDSRQLGLSTTDAVQLVNLLSTKGRVIISSELDLLDMFKPYQVNIPPEHMHDLLAHASMYIGDSQTMCAEAAVLGVPSIRCNSFVGRISYLEELEHRYGLTRGFLPSHKNEMVDLIKLWLTHLDHIKNQMQLRRQRMLQHCIYVTPFLLELISKKT
ncbi:MAG: DUF354 domain-containing protein [Desulfobacterales bacterium]|nr:DUF354 domain-containing protein [Desulfobacterales bacterium]